MGNFIQFLLSRYFWGNLLLMVLLTMALIWLTLKGLGSYTNHGESIVVPSFEGMSISEVTKQIESKALRYAVVDSSYNKDLPPGTVIDQNPLPDAKVKENRRIYLTINASTPPKVKIPDIINASRRNAMVQLESVGLEVGRQDYVPDLAKDAVLDMKLEGSSIGVGTEVAKGTKIDLVLGNGYGLTRIQVPELIQMTLLEAQLTLKANNLNIGAIIPKEDILEEERNEALVYQQSPTVGRMITEGEPVDLFITKNPIPEEEFDPNRYQQTPPGGNGTPPPPPGGN